jgi:LmbE family N-acetylglucosaminyl deacetylase
MFTPNLFVDITRYIGRKIKMLDCYATQRERRAYFDDESFRGLARARGAQAGYDYAEGFVIYKMLW